MENRQGWRSAPIALALLLGFQSGAAAAPGLSVDVDTETITVTAPRDKDAVLKTTRATGTAAAVGGLGLMGYLALASPAGPIGWAAALIFVGGMTAYLAHRRLNGYEDFSARKPNDARTPSVPASRSR